MFRVLTHTASWQHEFGCLLCLFADVTCVTSSDVNKARPLKAKAKTKTTKFGFKAKAKARD